MKCRRASPESIESGGIWSEWDQQVVLLAGWRTFTLWFNVVMSSCESESYASVEESRIECSTCAGMSEGAHEARKLFDYNSKLNSLNIKICDMVIIAHLLHIHVLIASFEQFALVKETMQRANENI